MGAEKRKGNPKTCNAKAKSTGKTCMNIAMKNGKCRVHGGAATGPKDTTKTRMNALKTGEYQSIWYDTLEDEEQELLSQVPQDAKELLDEQIRFLAIRERRMMKRIKDVLDGVEDNSIITNYRRHIVRDDHEQPVYAENESGHMEKQYQMVAESYQTQTPDKLSRIQNIEEALTRITAQKTKLIEMKITIDEGNVNESNGSLDRLNGILEKARADRAARLSQQDGNPQ